MHGLYKQGYPAQIVTDASDNIERKMAVSGESFTKCAQECISKPTVCTDNHRCRSELVTGTDNQVSRLSIMRALLFFC